MIKIASRASLYCLITRSSESIVSQVFTHQRTPYTETLVAYVQLYTRQRGKYSTNILCTLQTVYITEQSTGVPCETSHIAGVVQFRDLK